MITNERLQFWANSTARLDDSDTAEKIAMARELLDRRAPSAAEKELRDCLRDVLDVVMLWPGHPLRVRASALLAKKQ